MFDSDLYQCEIDIIYNYVEKLDKNIPRNYIEIGTYYGGTIKRILEKFNNSIRCYGIDLFEDYVEDFSKNTHGGTAARKEELEKSLLDAGYNNFQLIKGDSPRQILSLNQMSNTVFFIDANHKYYACLLDFLSCYHISTGSCFYIFHNASNDFEPDRMYVSDDGGPYRVIKDILSNHKYDVEYCGKADRCTVLKDKPC